jgi:calcium-dependent protein kinase
MAVRRARLISKDKLSKTGFKLEKKIIGIGSQATISLATNKKTGETAAVKVYEKKKAGFSEDELLLEIDAMSKCQHPGVVRLKSVHESKKTFEVLLEHCPGGEWRNVIHQRGSQPYTEGEAKALVTQLVVAVEWCNKKGVCHRDLKPENILVIPPQGDGSGGITLKLADFGLAAMIASTDEIITGAVGSPEYAAPEVVKPQAGGGYDARCDVWSLGVIFFLMLAGHLPFEGDDPSTIMRKVQNLQTVSTITCPSPCFDLYGGCVLTVPVFF